MNLRKKAGLVLSTAVMLTTLFQGVTFADENIETVFTNTNEIINNDIEIAVPDLPGDVLTTPAPVESTKEALDAVKEDKTDISVLQENKELKVTLSYKKIYVTGKKCKPKVKVIYKDEALEKNTDFTVSYKHNKKVGKAKVIINGIGDYSGTIKKKFTIKELSKVKLSKSCREFDKFIQGKAEHLAKKSVEVKYNGKIYKGKTGKTGNFQVELPQIKKSGEKIALRVKNQLAYSEWTTTKVEDYRLPEGLKRGKNGYCSPLKSGYRISRGTGKGHYGVDLCAPKGTPIFAAKYGEVIYAGYGTSEYNGYGYIVAVRDNDGFVQLYAHMMGQPVVKCGQKVFPGQHIGNVGSTGDSSGNHLHFEIRVGGIRHNVIDPCSVIDL